MIKLSGGLFAAGTLLFTVLCGTGSVDGLSCYECTSSTGDLCKGTVLKKFNKPVNCSLSLFTQANGQNEEFICISTTEQNSTETIYTRRCGLKSEESICQQTEGQTNGLNMTRCITCQKDLCNASVNIYSNLFLLVSVFVSCINLLKFNV